MLRGQVSGIDPARPRIAPIRGERTILRRGLNPRTATFPVLLGAAAGLSSIAIDSFVPSLPTLVREFGASVATVQLTVSACFLGLACGQVIYGPFSDHYGRRPPLIFGLALFLVATVFCASAGSVEALIAGRFFQALGATSGSVLSRSIVRDLYSWNEAAKTLAIVWTVFGLAPVFGPLIGVALLAAWGWQAIFWFMFAFGAPLFAAIVFGLPETAPVPRAKPPRPLTLARNYAFLLGQRHFLAYMLLIFFTQTGIFAFVSNSSFVLVTALGFSIGEFGLIVAVIMLGSVIGGALSSRYVQQLGIDTTIRWGVRLCFISAAAYLAIAWLRIDLAIAVIIPMFSFMFATALIVPHAMAAAMSPFPELAGAASSLTGLALLTGGALISVLLGALFDGTPWPLAAAMACSSLAALLVYERFIRRSPMCGRRSSAPEVID